MFSSYDSFSLYYLIPYVLVHKLEMLSKPKDIGVKLLLGLIWPQLNCYNVYFSRAFPSMFLYERDNRSGAIDNILDRDAKCYLFICLFVLDHDLLKVQKVIYCD